MMTEEEKKNMKRKFAIKFIWKKLMKVAKNSNKAK